MDDRYFERTLEQVIQKARSVVAKKSTIYFFPDNDDFIQYVRIKFWTLYSRGKYNKELSEEQLNSFQWKFVNLRAIDYLRSLNKKSNIKTVSLETLEQHFSDDDDFYMYDLEDNDE